MLCDVGGHIGILNTDCSISTIQKQKEMYSYIFLLPSTSYIYSSSLLLAIRQAAAVMNALWHP